MRGKKNTHLSRYIYTNTRVDVYSIATKIADPTSNSVSRLSVFFCLSPSVYFHHTLQPPGQQYE